MPIVFILWVQWGLGDLFVPWGLVEGETKGERNECLVECAVGLVGQERRPSEHPQTQRWLWLLGEGEGSKQVVQRDLAGQWEIIRNPFQFGLGKCIYSLTLRQKVLVFLEVALPSKSQIESWLRKRYWGAQCPLSGRPRLGPREKLHPSGRNRPESFNTSFWDPQGSHFPFSAAVSTSVKSRW